MGFWDKFKSLIGIKNTVKREIAVLDNGPVNLFTDPSGAEVSDFIGDFDVDCDGTGGNPHKDPCFQPDTRLHYKGRALHAETVPYAVVPPCIIREAKGIVMGCLCICTNTETGAVARAVVGDSGPTKKDGEGSPRLAELLGLDPDPNHGGTDRKIIRYQIYIGVPAVIDGITYELQAS